jgi:predicted CopG family antitoxin
MSQIPAKLVRVSDDSYRKVQKAQRVRESYGDIVARAINTLLEKEGQ